MTSIDHLFSRPVSVLCLFWLYAANNCLGFCSVRSQWAANARVTVDVDKRRRRSRRNNDDGRDESVEFDSRQSLMFRAVEYAAE